MRTWEGPQHSTCCATAAVITAVIIAVILGEQSHVAVLEQELGPE